MFLNSSLYRTEPETSTTPNAGYQQRDTSTMLRHQPAKERSLRTWGIVAAKRSASAVGIVMLAALTPPSVGLISRQARAESMPRGPQESVSRDLQSRSARVLNASDTAHLHLEKTRGAQLLEQGSASGQLPGTLRVRFDVGPRITASFTIYTHGGSLSGHGSGTLHSTGVYASFGGSMTITNGTGLYQGAHGHGGLYGVLNRNTYALTVQTTGTLHY